MRFDFILLVAFLLTSCGGLGEDKTDQSTTITGDNNTIVIIEESDVVQSCSAIEARAENSIDCDDDEVKVNCEMCFDEEFREGIEVDVSECIEQLQVLEYCE